MEKLYRAGWRPLAGWAAALGLLYQSFLAPLLTGLTGKQFPAIDIETLVSVTTAAVGFGVMRTVEKVGGKGQ